MKISLIGYMGSGKSLIAKELSHKLSIPVMDTDFEISNRNNKSITEIFETRGEIFFRKQERLLLEEVIAYKDSIILSLGGGTPCYYNNMELLNENTHTIFLRASVATLADNILINKTERPIVAKIQKENLHEFIAKHLFERNPFYTLAKTTISIDGKTPEKIVQEIIENIKK